MSDFRVRIFHDVEEILRRDRSTGAIMKEKAEEVKSRVRASSRFTLLHRGGIGRRGAFGQVIMRGPGAITEEFGNQSRSAKAPLRSALRSGR